MSRAIRDKFSKQCLANCPQIRACAMKAVVDNAVSGTPISYGMGVALDQAIEEGLLPERGCEDGPRKAMLAKNPSRSDEIKTVKGTADLVGMSNWGSPIVRVCSAEFDS